jgi:hypothetical protein
MTSVSDEDAGRHGAGGAPGAEGTPATMPWWTSARLRLSLLLACLAAAIVALLAGGSGFSSSSSGTAIGAGRSCAPAPPPLAQASVGQLRDLHASLLAMMEPLSRTRYAYGIAEPQAAWFDESPSNLRSSLLADGDWPAGFEMRSWVVDPQLTSAYEDVGADVFMFAGAAQARSYFTQASSARCHRDGVEGSSSRPPLAHTLAWVNPDDATEEDIFLLRGPRVYRVAVVRPQGRTPSASQRQAGLARAAALACALPDAGCVHSGATQRQPAGHRAGGHG